MCFNHIFKGNDFKNFDKVSKKQLETMWSVIYEKEKL